jgi:hypothetical protein
MLAGAVSGGQAPQAPPRSGPAKPVAGGTVKGRITAMASGQPLHRVRITLNGGVANAPTAVTDTRGTFEVTDVPPGTYSVTAARAGYITIQYGQRRPREAGRTIAIASGQTIENIDLRLPRGSVLAGRITDEIGDPSPGVRVEAVELRYVRGRRISVPAKVASTNDAGEYRLSGLEPGMYQIRASTTDIWEGDDGKETFAHAVTAFPGVAGSDAAQSLTLAVGQEISGLDFALIAGRAARITGVVEDANGQPMPSQVVNLDRISRTVGGALLSAGFGGTARTDARGAFEIAKLAPGEYQAYTGGPNDRVSQRVMLNDGESKAIVLTPRKPTAIGGAIVTDEDAPPPFAAARLSVVPIAATPDSLLPGWSDARAQTPKADWSFRIVDADGQYLFRVTGQPDEWMLKAVTHGGRDITDVPLPVARGAADVEGLQIVMSRKGAAIAGDVVTADGAPGADATVVVFAENRALWSQASRFVKAARPDDRGHFSIAGLPAGVYRAIAQDAVVDGQWEDPDFLQTVMNASTRIELAAAGSETVKLVLETRR